VDTRLRQFSELKLGKAKLQVCATEEEFIGKLLKAPGRISRVGSRRQHLTKLR
jgi:hypothetical protein